MVTNHYPNRHIGILQDTHVIDQLAMESEFQKRRPRKITPTAVLKALIISSQKGEASLRKIAINLGILTQQTISKQNLHERLNEYAESWLVAVLGKALQIPPEKSSTQTAFNRIILEDATAFVFDKSMSDDFEAHGNGHGKTAGCKTQLAFDLLTGCPIKVDLTSATQNDKEAGWETIEMLMANDLALRDMGYFSIASLKAIIERNAYFITRVPSTTQIFDIEGVTFNFIKELHDSSEINHKEWEVKVGKEALFQARMCASRVNDEIAKEHRRKLKEGKSNPTKLELLLCDWVIVITNVTAEMMEAKDVTQAYRLRWQIEIKFKAWKHGKHLERTTRHKTNSCHLMCLVLAHLIGSILTMHQHMYLCSSTSKVSYSMLKVSCILQSHMPSLHLMESISNQEEYWELLKIQLDYHGSYEKRKRVNAIQRMSSVFNEN